MLCGAHTMLAVLCLCRNTPVAKAAHLRALLHFDARMRVPRDLPIAQWAYPHRHADVRHREEVQPFKWTRTQVDTSRLSGGLSLRVLT